MGDFRQGSGVAPDSGEATLRSRLGRNYQQLPVRLRLCEKLLPAEEKFCPVPKKKAPFRKKGP
jgi:hypothetical protein